ncbi:MAG: hypothetical protein ACJ790_01105 [Myxococcaceae bacterium]
MTEEVPARKRGQLWKRLPLVIIVALGIWLWRGGGGLVAADHELVFQMPEDRGQVRRFEYQLYDPEGTLLKREEFELPSGAESELRSPNKLPLKDGPYTVKVFRWVEGGAASIGSNQSVDVDREEQVVIAVPRLDGGV